MKLDGRSLAVMQVLWERGEATIAQLKEWIDVEKPLAYSTIATVVSRLEKRKLVAYRVVGRTYVYHATISEDGAGKTMIGDLLNKVFDGSPSQLVSHLLESEHVDQSELESILQLVRDHQKTKKKQSKSRKRKTS